MWLSGITFIILQEVIDIRIQIIYILLDFYMYFQQNLYRCKAVYEHYSIWDSIWAYYADFFSIDSIGSISDK